MNRFFPCLLVAACVFAFGGRMALAQLLITVDVSNPSAVTFSATGNPPMLSLNTSESNFNENLSYFEGITLANFFTASLSYSPDFALGSGNLELYQQGVVYTSANLGALVSATPVDLNLFTADLFPQIFNISNPAFDGSATLTSSNVPSYERDDFLSLLPANGASGILYAGQGQTAVAIGRWQVGTGDLQAVPEPRGLALVVLVMGGAFIWWQRRQPAV